MENIYLLLAIILSPLFGIAAFYIVKNREQPSSDESTVSVQDTSVAVAQQPVVDNVATAVDKQAIVLEARSKAKEIIVEAKDEALKIKQAAEDRAKDINVKEAELNVKDKEVKEKEESVKTLRESLQSKADKIDELTRQKQEKLEKVANLTRDEARQELLKLFDKDLAEEKSKRLRTIEEDIKKNKDVMAQEILINAMRHGATDYVVQHTTSKVKIPDEDIKGRIIGKEGRNIRTFEELTGVELDLDSSPGEIIVSSFDPIRREIAKVALERLIADGRIQPTRIEEVVQQTQTDIDKLMYKEGDNLCHRLGVYNIPDDLVQMLGKFKYRYSYGQNMIEHTLEETKIGVAIAKELNADAEVVKLGCLFHDIGKVVNDEEGTHVQLGVDLLKKYKIQDAVVNAVAEHHEDRPFSSVESAIVALADHVSGARPGARSEDYEAYVERMKNLEDAAMSFDGVDKVYAISAGREVRVFVKPERVDDDTTSLLAREIAKKIELEQTYPGVVKVTVIREIRATDTAK
jgi:ribonucrease Y